MVPCWSAHITERGLGVYSLSPLVVVCFLGFPQQAADVVSQLPAQCHTSAAVMDSPSGTISQNKWFLPCVTFDNSILSQKELLQRGVDRIRVEPYSQLHTVHSGKRAIVTVPLYYIKWHPMAPVFRCPFTIMEADWSSADCSLL